MRFPKLTLKTKLHIAVLLLAMLFSALMTFHLGQDLNWDLLNYHLYVPYAFLHHRLIYDVEPAQLQTYNNPLLELPAYLLITHFRPVIAGMALGAIQGINLWLVFEVTFLLLRRVIKKYSYRFVIAAGIAAFSLFGAAFTSELGNTMGDSLTSIGVLAALLLLLLSLDKPTLYFSSRKLRLIAYFIIGIIVGLKLTNAMFGAALLLAGLMVEGDYKEKIKQALRHIGMILVGILVASGFWYIKMWQLFKNPIFPYYNTIFHSPNYASVNFIDTRWFPKTALGKIFYPFTFARLQNAAAEIPFRDPRFAVMFTMIVVALLIFAFQKFILKRKFQPSSYPRQYWAFWIFMLASYVIWEKQFSYYRYLICIELLTLTAIALIIYGLIKNRRTATVVLVILFGLITHFTTPINWGRIHWQPNYFGPNLRQQLTNVRGVVLTAGGNPTSFLDPYLPSNTSVVRVASNMTSPTTGTKTEQSLIGSYLKSDVKRRETFYAIETSNGQSLEQIQLKEVGFTSSKCSEINTYVGQYLFYGTMQYLLCDLTLSPPIK